MEQKALKSWFFKNFHRCHQNIIDDLFFFAEEILARNSEFNLTGLKTIDNIINELVIGSLEPFEGVGVPRGTSCVDLGTGAGIPGIPLAVMFPDSDWVLVDSNAKKVAFIENLVKTLNIDNVRCTCGRIEELAREDGFFERFDFAVSRAMANPFMACELATGFLKRGGSFYLYSKVKEEDLPRAFLDHLPDLSFVMGPESNEAWENSLKAGLIFTKVSSLRKGFPRRYAVIKREGRRVFKDVN